MSVRGEGRRTLALADVGDSSTVENRFRQWKTLSVENELAEQRLKDLRDDLMDAIDAAGDEDAGHKYLELASPIEIDGKVFSKLKRERRVRTVFSEEKTRELLESKGPSFVDEVFVPVMSTQFDTDALYVLYQRDIITEDELDGLMDTTYQYAFKPLTD